LSGRTYIIVVKTSLPSVDADAEPPWAADFQRIVQSAKCGPGDPYQYMYDPEHPVYQGMLQTLIDKKEYMDAAQAAQPPAASQAQGSSGQAAKRVKKVPSCLVRVPCSRLT
jgi:hypothetical protein